MYQKRTARREQAARTRQHIYNCAIMLFKQKGYDNVTVEEVATAAGMSVGAFYHHFKSKSEIFAIYHENLDNDYQDFYKNVLCSDAYAGKMIPDKLSVFIRFIVGTCVREGLEYVRVVYPYMLSTPQFGQDMVSPTRPYFHLITSMVEEGQRLHQLRRDLSSQRIANDITIICRGCIVDWCVNGGLTDIAQASASIIDGYVAGISL